MIDVNDREAVSKRLFPAWHEGRSGPKGPPPTDAAIDRAIEWANRYLEGQTRAASAGAYAVTPLTVGEVLRRLGVGVSEEQICIATGCDEPAIVHNLCRRHSRRKSEPRTLEERFWKKVDKDGPILRPELGPCWVWTAAATQGRGRVVVEGRLRVASQIAWELTNGRPVPADNEVCHHCDNGLCVRPEHLYAANHKRNMQDMSNRGRAYRQNTTHCIHGHAYTPENTIHKREGGRRCRTCEDDRYARRQAEKRLRRRRDAQ